MNSSEELIKKRNSLSQKTYTDTKSVCIILEASERIPLGSPPGNPRIRNLPHGGCLCLPLFLSPFSPRGFQREKEKSSAYLEYKGKNKQTAAHTLPPWHPRHLQPSKPLPAPRGAVRPRPLPAGLLCSALCPEHLLWDCLKQTHIINRQG